mgnify:CR=1 FL=1
MKNRVIVKKKVEEVTVGNQLTKKELLVFFLKNATGEYWMFEQPFSKGVYEWFMYGRGEGEILSFSKWNQNKRLSNTINHISMQMRYIKKYVMEVMSAA